MYSVLEHTSVPECSLRGKGRCSPGSGALEDGRAGLQMFNEDSSLLQNNKQQALRTLHLMNEQELRAYRPFTRQTESSWSTLS